MNPSNKPQNGPAAKSKEEQQKQAARAPQAPTKEAPKTVPAQSGKPVWDKPHSS